MEVRRERFTGAHKGRPLYPVRYPAISSVSGTPPSSSKTKAILATLGVNPVVENPVVGNPVHPCNQTKYTKSPIRLKKT